MSGRERLPALAAELAGAVAKVAALSAEIVAITSAEVSLSAVANDVPRLVPAKPPARRRKLHAERPRDVDAENLPAELVQAHVPAARRVMRSRGITPGGSSR